MELLPSSIPFDFEKMNEEVKALLPVPDTAQSAENLSSLVNWAPLVHPLISAIKPRRVVEIGVDEGRHTVVLEAICRDLHVPLWVVDPKVSPSVRRLAEAEKVHLFEGRSADFLRKEPGSGFFLVDGDHNYATVSEELRLIHAGSLSDPGPLFIVVHDVGWPCGLRDAFYCPTDDERSRHLLTQTEGPLPWLEELVPEGYAASFFAWTQRKQGPGNGVRTAVYDFTTKHPEWQAFFTPALFGLALLWQEERLPEKGRLQLDRWISALKLVEPILATLEWNRILLLVKIQLQGKLWEGQHAYIRELEDRMAGNKVIDTGR